MNIEDLGLNKTAESDSHEAESCAVPAISEAKSRIIEKIRADMQKKEEVAILAFDKNTSHSRYSSN